MKHLHPISVLLLCTGLLWTSGISNAADVQRVQLLQRERTIDVLVDGKLFTTYHFADDFILPFVRPFFWPVNAPDGTPLTADQAQTVPGHPHQRSIWIGHGDVNGAEHWKVTHKPVQPKQRHVDLKNVEADGFTEDLVWEDKKAQPMLSEIRKFRFLVYADGARAIDIKMQLTAIDRDVTFGTARDHGLLAVRMVPSIADHPTLLNAGGADTDDTVSNKRSAWCDESGQIDGKTYGVAIFDSPDNIRHPPYWHASLGTHIGPDIVGPKTSKTINAEPGSGPLTIASKQTLMLHYLVLFHQGDAQSAGLNQKYGDFIAGR